MSTAVVARSAFARVTAPFTWRGQASVARRLLHFAATEAGSARDMLRAVEVTTDPELRRLFFQHALDEESHARMFRKAAAALDSTVEEDRYSSEHARCAHVLERHGLTQFIVFIHLSERSARARFGALAEHFSGHPMLHALFSQLECEERFHERYAANILARWVQEGRAADVRRATAAVQARLAWAAWRRAGRRLGDVLADACVWLTCAGVMAPFALLVKRQRTARAGWVVRSEQRVAHPESEA